MSWIKAAITFALKAYLGLCAIWLCTGCIIGFFLFVCETKDTEIDIITGVSFISLLVFGVCLSVKAEHDKQA